MMTTYAKDGHLFFRELPGKPDSLLGDRLIINPKTLKEASVYARENGIKSITINSAFFSVDNLDFLQYFDFIEGLYILQDKLELVLIEHLAKLRVLTLSDVKPKLDLANLVNLQVLGTSWCRNLKNLEKCKKLYWLWLDNFKQENVESIKMLQELEYLNLYKTTVANLEGIDNLKVLQSLKIDSAHNLTSLDGISEDNAELKVVDIYNAKNLQDCSALALALNLEKILIRKTGDLSNISFINNLQRLREVAIGSKIMDGEVSALKKIEKASFLDFPHYNLKMKDLKV